MQKRDLTGRSWPLGLGEGEVLTSTVSIPCQDPRGGAGL
jgi:hypothetical protein